MSFILDALRKSDNERRQQAAPTLTTVPQAAPAKKRSLWIPVLVIVLAINAILFSYIFLTRGEPTPAAISSEPSAEPEVRSLRKEPLINESLADAEAAEETIELIETAPKPDTPAAQPVIATEPTQVASKVIQEDLPRLSQMRAAGLISAANLHLDMHVYSDDAAKRFVFVNMVKYREGERLPEGPTIEEITPDGVIMIQQGNRFRLDRD